MATGHKVQPRLGIVMASVREGRAGQAVLDWFAGVARAHGGFEIEVLDLKAIDLPILEERHHPRFAKYEQPGTIAWSRTVAALDAFVFVTPEYNHSAPPALVNALDHLFAEWHYKPVGFVSYAGISAGLRSVTAAKPIVNALKMVPINEGVPIPFFAQLIDKETGKFNGGESNEKAATVMLDELVRWEAALRTLRPAPTGA